MGIFDKRSDTEKEIDQYNKNRKNPNSAGAGNYGGYNNSYSNNYSNSYNNANNSNYTSNNYNPNSNTYGTNSYPNNMPNHNSTPNNYNGYNPNNSYPQNDYPNNNGMPNNYNGYNPNNSYNNTGYGMHSQYNNMNNQNNPNRVHVKPQKGATNAIAIAFFVVFFLAMFTPVFVMIVPTVFTVDIMTVLFLALFSFFGLSIAIGPFITAGVKKRRCKVPVKAIVIDMKSRRGSKGKRVYAPVYQYFYGGIEYIATATSYRNYALPNCGDEIDILVNELNPEDYYVDETRANIATLVVGLIFVVFPLIMIFA